MSNDLENDPSWLALIEAFETGLIIVEGEPIIYEYRVYHDESGNVKRTTILQRDPILEGPYVVVDEDIYKNLHKYIFKNGKAIKRRDNILQTAQIVPSKTETGFRVVKNHPVLLLEDIEEYNDIEYYDYRSY